MSFRSALQKARVIVWGEPPESKEERKLLVKIDWFILSFTCLNYWSNYLNRTNYANAYVSGMKQDLHFQGNQYNDVITVFTVGYIVGQIPNVLAIQYIPPRYYFSFMSMLWGILSACISKVHTVEQLYVIRFFQAIAESSTFAGSHYVLGSWYKEEELGKRSGIFASSAQMGSLFSGVMQGAIHSNMNGLHGLAGWRWLFIIDACIAIGVAIYGFIFFPDTPTKTRAFYFSKEERELAAARLPPRTPTKMSWNLIKRVLTSWQWYGFSILFAVSSMLEVYGFLSLFTLWLDAEHYPVSKVNYYSLGLVAVAIAVTLVWATITDHTHSRHHVNYFMALALIFTAIVLRVYTGVPRWLLFAAFCIAGCGYAGQATNFAWANAACKDDDQMRAVVIASMNMWSNVLAAWWGLVFYPSTDAPRWKKGHVVTIVMAILTVLVSEAVRYLDRPGAREMAEERMLTEGTGTEYVDPAVKERETSSRPVAEELDCESEDNVQRVNSGRQ
ncbi:MFS general substrate transporter [Clavulina sp. PMI_390]|nr:MFS general substrate transporter [Clavulina sp. PMI_390]